MATLQIVNIISHIIFAIDFGFFVVKYIRK